MNGKEYSKVKKIEKKKIYKRRRKEESNETHKE